jgi:hypothetical protein
MMVKDHNPAFGLMAFRKAASTPAPTLPASVPILNRTRLAKPVIII